MNYYCKICGFTLPAGVMACPRCGSAFDEAVPQDAEMPKPGSQLEAENTKLPSADSAALPLISSPRVVNGEANTIKQVVWGISGTVLSGLVGGWMYVNQINDRTTNSTEAGAVIGFIGLTLAFTIAAMNMRPFSIPHFVGMWIACAVVYPICLYIGFNGTISAAKSAMMSKFDVQAYQQQFHNQNGRDATPEEVDQVEQQAEQILSNGLDNSDMGLLEKDDLFHQIFWGPFLTSCLAGGVLLWQKRRVRANCPRCGNSVPSNSRFCSKCGQGIHSQPIAPT